MNQKYVHVYIFHVTKDKEVNKIVVRHNTHGTVDVCRDVSFGALSLSDLTELFLDAKSIFKDT